MVASLAGHAQAHGTSVELQVYLNTPLAVLQAAQVIICSVLSQLCQTAGHMLPAQLHCT